MTPDQNEISLSSRVALVLLVALVLWATWLYEVVYSTCWPGLAWTGLWLSPLIACPLISLAVWCATLFRSQRGTRGRSAIFFATSIPALLGVEWLTSWSLLLAFSRFGGGIPLLTVAGPTCSLLGAAAVCLPLRLAGAPTSLFRFLGASIAFLGILPLACVTVWLGPSFGSAYDGHDILHAVKMGYAAFWAVLLPAMALLELPQNFVVRLIFATLVGTASTPVFWLLTFAYRIRPDYEPILQYAKLNEIIAAMKRAGGVNAESCGQRFPLNEAIAANRFDVAAYLLKHDADIHSMAIGSVTPLQLACEHWAITPNKPAAGRIIYDLLEKGADPNAEDMVNGYTPTTAFVLGAAHTEFSKSDELSFMQILAALRAKGGKLDASDHWGYTIFTRLEAELSPGDGTGLAPPSRRVLELVTKLHDEEK
ncbi:MAG: hypothetical protein U0136_16615 [Bdellovibrionota bacterium]